MSQPSVTAYFNSRKRAASEEIRNKSKVLILDNKTRTNPSRVTGEAGGIKNDVTEKSSENAGPLTPVSEETQQSSSPKLVYANDTETKTSSVVRNIQFDLGKSSGSQKMTPKAGGRARVSRTRKFSVQEGQTDIRDTFLKFGAEGKEATKVVTFEKMGPLSPRKKTAGAKSTDANKEGAKEKPAAGSVTPKKSSFMDRLAKQDLSIGEIKNRINRSSRLAELRASIARIQDCQDRLDKIEKAEETKKPQIKKFQKIELEVPVR